MSATPKKIEVHQEKEQDAEEANVAFLKALPTIRTHARVQFRHLPSTDREEAVAEAIASAFLNFHNCHRNGKSDRITPFTLARYSVLKVKDGQHVGGSMESRKDAMSPKAQRRNGFRVVGLPWDSEYVYDCLRDPSSPVWREVLLEDKSTPVPDQAAFRIDWSQFLAQQHDRTRRCMALLAEGHKRCQVADRMGTTPPAVTQRMARVEREWDRFQGNVEDEVGSPADAEPCTAK